MSNEQEETHSHSQQDTLVQDEHKVERPKMYHVVLHNDDYTTMDFVLMILTQIFFKTEEEAMRIMLEVHYKGRGIAGTYTYEIAETKMLKVQKLSKQSEYPLQCSMEPAE